MIVITYKNYLMKIFQMKTRGIAVLAIDGPGQAEAVSRGIYFSPENWEKCANAVYDFLSQQPNIDIKNLVIRGSSFGSFSARAGSRRRRGRCVGRTAPRAGEERTRRDGEEGGGRKAGEEEGLHIQRRKGG